MPFNQTGEKAKPGDAFILTTAARPLPYRGTTVQNVSKAGLPRHHRRPIA